MLGKKLNSNPVTDELDKLKKYSRLREKIAIQKDIPVRRVLSDKEIKLICKHNIDKEIKKKIMLKLNIKKFIRFLNSILENELIYLI